MCADHIFFGPEKREAAIRRLWVRSNLLGNFLQRLENANSLEGDSHNRLILLPFFAGSMESKSNGTRFRQIRLETVLQLIAGCEVAEIQRFPSRMGTPIRGYRLRFPPIGVRAFYRYGK